MFTFVFARQKIVAAALMLGLAQTANAQSTGSESGSIPWAYSNYFGTGWYEIGDDRDAFVMRYVYRRQLRDTSMRDGKRESGLELRVPVTVGLDEFPLEDLQGSVNPENFANLSIAPGLYVDVPVHERWLLRPFASIGYGRLLEGSGSAWSWWGGVLSRYRLGGPLRATLINGVGVVGYSPNEGRSENFWPLLTALEFTHDVATWADGDDRLRLHWHLAFTHFHDDLDLSLPQGAVESVSEQWEAGFAFSRERQPLRLLWLEFDRFGLAYRRSSSSDLQGVALVFRSLFDQ